MLAAAWRELGRFHALVGINIRRPQAELHHRSAIEMARTAKAEGLDQADLSQIADDIIRTQQAEIDQMTDWRRDWFGSGEIDPEGAALGPAETEMGMQHVADDLVGAEDVDRAFASMMIDHTRARSGWPS